MDGMIMGGGSVALVLVLLVACAAKHEIFRDL
jgi:hypothetical protein